MYHTAILALAGAAAGAVNGLLGAGGGLILVPLLAVCGLQDTEIFPSSISVMLPICVVSLIVTAVDGSLAWNQAMPYLLGSTAGGVLAGLYGRKIPTSWLHRGLGILILWGGIRYIC